MIVPLKKHIVTSRFGNRILNGQVQFHCGVDLMSYSDWNVYAPVDGTITFAGWAGTAGNMVILETINYRHRFMHLQKITVQKDSQIKQGDIIGVYGNTGFSFGAHLHWDIFYKPTQKFENPENLIQL